MKAVLNKISLIQDFWRLTKPAEFSKILYTYLQTGHAPDRLHCEYNGRPFVARRGDWPALREVFLEGEYDCLTKIFQPHESPKILDLGAHIGCFALRAFTHNNTAEIYSFEAAPDTASLLEENKALNPDFKWNITRAAVWSDNKPIYLNRSPSSLGHRVGNAETGEAIAALTPEDILAKTGWDRIDLIKMDIEGAEEKVIPAASALLSRANHLLIEIHNDRIDGEAVLSQIKKEFSHIYKLGGRWSNKPVLLFSRNSVEFMTNWKEDLAA